MSDNGLYAIAATVALVGLTFTGLKFHNDLSIAVDTRRIAVALEKLAGVGPETCVSRPLPGLVVHGRCSSTEGRHDR